MENPKAIFKRIPDAGAVWFLLNWTNRDGLALLAPTLGSLIDAAREEDAAKSSTMLCDAPAGSSELAAQLSVCRLMAKEPVFPCPLPLK